MSQRFPRSGSANWQNLAVAILLAWGCLYAEEPGPAPSAKYPDHNPIASTGVMSKRVGGRTQDLSASVVGAKKLYLVVLPTEKYLTENAAAWLEPRLVGPAGVKKLSELPPIASANEGGPVAVNKTMSGRPFQHLGQPVEYGLGVKAPSILEFEIPEGYAQFLTTVSVDPMNPAEQEVKGSVRFKVFTDLPGEASQFPELDSKEKEKAAAEKAKLLAKAKTEISDARKKLQKAQERWEKEKQHLDEEQKRFEGVLKKYPGVGAE
jgi:hypothetical protein